MFNLFKKKPVERICKNCLLFSPKTETCSVRVLYAGEKYKNIPVDPKDSCLWEELGIAEHIQQVRFWVEDDAGNKTNGNGTVKIEYPEGFFPD